MLSLAGLEQGGPGAAELGRSDSFAGWLHDQEPQVCSIWGEGPSRPWSTPAVIVASLFLQVWRVWFERRDGIRSGWVGIREVFPVRANGDLPERVDELHRAPWGLATGLPLPP